MRDLLEDLVRKFNERVEEDPNLREEVGDLRRTIQVATDRSRYHMTLADGRIGDVSEGEAPDPEVTITADEETLRGVLEGRIPTFKAMATRKLKVKAGLEDMLRLRKLLA